MKLYRGNIGDFTGGIVASWFVTGVKGPVAFATGFVEMRYAPWCLFYRGIRSLIAKSRRRDKKGTMARNAFRQIRWQRPLALSRRSRTNWQQCRQ